MLWLLGFLLASQGGYGQVAPPEQRLLQNDPRSILTQDETSVKASVLTSIADMQNRDVREAPAHVQVITAGQIQASGARDLFDALQLVPGLAYALGRDDAFGVAVRGNWAMEGRCLFMINGQPLNENDFGTFTINDRVSLDNVERVEVLLGPSSTLHGAYASMGVVNIVTRTASDREDARATIRSGVTALGHTRTSASVSGAHRLSRTQEISYLFNRVQGSRSNALQDRPDGSVIDGQDSTRMQASSLQFNYRWKDLKAYLYYLDEVFAGPGNTYQIDQRDVIVGLEHRLIMGAKAELLSKFSHTEQLPWNYLGSTDPERLRASTMNSRNHASLVLMHRTASWLRTRFGVQGFAQQSRFLGPQAGGTFNLNHASSINMQAMALFLEAEISGRAGNLTVGYRLEDNSLLGQAASPRLAYTKAIGRFHTKVLWGRSFRMPALMEVNAPDTGIPLRSEFTTTAELELGVLVGRSGSFTLNAYDNRIDDPIVQVQDPVSGTAYLNRSFTGTQGIDLRLTTDQGPWMVTAGLGVYQLQQGSDVKEYRVPADLGQGHLGIPTARGSLGLSWHTMDWLSLRTRVNWNGRTWAYQLTDGAGRGPVPVERPDELLIHFGLRIQPGRHQRLSVDLGCNDILDQQRVLLGPTTTPSDPFRMNGREITLALTYRFVQ
ncbi:MAG: TonB-dependent receptor [Flavobacteriales bacterium]|nr:TonB-dependent receptor [Flavobacteriales bacterium]